MRWAQKSICNRQNIIDAVIDLIVKVRLLVVAASGEVIAHAGNTPPEVDEHECAAYEGEVKSQTMTSSLTHSAQSIRVMVTV